MKPMKKFLKGKREGKKYSNRGDDVIQSILNACVGKSQRNPFMQIIYTN
jgi:hypothetical protein